MSSEKQGWLSSVSRLFSGGQQYTGRLVGQKSGDTQHSSNSDSTSSHQNFTSVNGGYPLSAVAESSSKPSRNLRYLSPSALDDKSSLSCSTTRKRILTQDDRPSTAIDLLLTQVNPKRSKTDQFASSMLENLSPRLFTEHLDSRMSRTVSGLSSASDFLHSPVSNRSLIERIGSNRSNASSLSSKTRAILNHLERINTPAREARKLPVMRGPTLPPERWAPLNPASPGVPPLLKRNLNVPSRIQLLSVSMASQRKPYWRDITRNVKEKETSTCPKEDGGKSGSISVHPLFDMDSADSIRACSNKSSKSRQQNVGSDLTTRNGHSSEELTELTKKSVGNGHTNVFNADKLLDEEVESEIPVFAPPTEAAPSEFRDDMVFNFDAPVVPQLGRLTDEGCDFTLEERRRNRHASGESSSGDSDDEQQSCGSEADEINTEVDYEKDSRPSTAADSETSVSAAITPTSSKDVSPQARAEESWKCPECFKTNKKISACAACDYKNEGRVASESPVSNVTSSVKPAVRCDTFSVALQSSTGSRTNSTERKPDSLEAQSNSKSYESHTPAIVNPITVSAPISSQAPVIGNPPGPDTERTLEVGESSKERKDWECPVCMVPNKASHDKCACCGHVMYKSGETQATSNAFGERAFKAGTTPSTISFGFGGSNTSSSGKTFKFGFGASDVTESAATNTDSSAIKTTTIAPVIPKSVLSSEPGKDTLANTPPLCKSTTESTNPHASTFTIGSGTGLFGSQPKPPLFDSVSSTAFKPSSFTGSFMPTLSTSAPTNTSTTLAAGKSSQGVSISAPAPLVFGSGSTSLLGQAGLPNAKDAENNPNRATPFGSTLSFGALPSSSAEVLPSTTTTSGSNAEPTGIVPSATSNIFGTAGAAKPVFSPFGITPESSKPFMNTVTSTGNQEVSTSSQVQAPLFGISSTTFANKPLFGASTSSASSNSNGGPGFIFGSTNTFGGFGNATSSTTVSSSLPTISSNAPIFGSATSVPEAQKPFQFNTTLPESIFQFGKEPLSGSTPFQFGSIATSSVPSFQTSGIAAPAAPSSNFTFTSTNNRRIASARRRLPPRK